MILSEIAQIDSASKSRQVLTVCSLLKLMEHNILGLWQKPCTCRILWQQSFVEVHQAFTGLICRGSKIPFIIRKLPKFTTLTLHLSIPASVSSCSTVVQSSIYDSNSFVLEMYGFYVQSLNFRSNCYNQSIFLRVNGLFGIWVEHLPQNARSSNRNSSLIFHYKAINQSLLFPHLWIVLYRKAIIRLFFAKDNTNLFINGLNAGDVGLIYYCPAGCFRLH